MRISKISLFFILFSNLIFLRPLFAEDTIGAQPGLFRLLSADIMDKDAYNFQTNFQYFQQSGLLKDVYNSTVRRTQGGIAFGYAITPNIQLSGSGGFTISTEQPQAASQTTAASETIDLVKAAIGGIGTYDVGEKFFHLKARRFTAGFALDIDLSKITRIVKGFNFDSNLIFTGDFTDAQLAPFRTHLNIGFIPGNGGRYYDKSDYTVKDLDRFATNTFNSYAFTAGAGVEFPFHPITPSVEIHIQKLAEVGMSKSPKWVTPGIKARPFPQKNIEILAAVDLGFSSFTPQPASANATYPKPAVGPTPLWNLVLGFSVSNFGRKANEISVDQVEYENLKDSLNGKEKMIGGLQHDLEFNTVQGRVFDARTKEPMSGIQLSFPDTPDLKPSSVDPDGKFIRYFHHLAGARMVFTKDGYDPSSKFLALKPGERVNVDIEMTRSSGEAQSVFVSTITDPEGLGIPASITFTNLKTKEAYIATADSAGQMNVRVKPGTYSLVIKSNGMQNVTDQIEMEPSKTVLRSYSMLRDRAASPAPVPQMMAPAPVTPPSAPTPTVAPAPAPAPMKPEPQLPQ